MLSPLFTLSLLVSSFFLSQPALITTTLLSSCHS
jgi:hypothetical protein